MTDKPWEAPPPDLDPRCVVLLLSLMAHFEQEQGWDALPMAFVVDENYTVEGVAVSPNMHPIEFLHALKATLGEQLHDSTGTVFFCEGWVKDPITFERTGDEERMFHYVTPDRATVAVSVSRSDPTHPRWSTGAQLAGPLIDAVESLYA